MFFSFLIICIVVLFLSPTLLWFICWIIARISNHSIPYAPFAYIGIALILLFLGTMWYGYRWGRHQLHVEETTYFSHQVPAAFDGYKIVHISDLHMSSMADNPNFLQRVIDTINAQQADLICFTGDFVGFGVEEAIPFTNILRQMHAKDGVVSVLGNHDFALYHHGLSNAEKEQKVEELTHYQRDTLSWKLLRNQSVIISRNHDTLQVIGVDNASCQGQGFQTVYRADLPKAIQTPYNSLHTIPEHADMLLLLSHDPSHWRAEILHHTDIPLTLSGHTHAGQIRIFGYPLSSLMFSESQGWYNQDGQSLYINTGIGCTLPVRVAVPAEITVITLQRKE